MAAWILDLFKLQQGSSLIDTLYNSDDPLLIWLF